MRDWLSIGRSFSDVFRNTEAEVALPCAAGNPLKTIVAAGANYNKADGLGAQDQVWVSSAVDFCASHNIAVAPDFRVIPVNMENGQDILDPQLRVPADIFIACYIPNPALLEGWHLEKLREQNGAMFNVSPFHTKTAWAEAAERSGARLIVAYNQSHEISSEDFLILPGYVKGPQQNMLVQAVVNEKPQAAYYTMETVLREDLATEYLRFHGTKKGKDALFS